MMVGIIDYGMGNLRSLENALDRLCAPYVISDDAAVLKDCDRLILPGVGAFADGMKNMADKGLAQFVIHEAGVENKPLLGICLGMQMLYEESEENGRNAGLCLLQGTVKRMQGDVRIPCIGWNLLEKQQDHPVYKRLSTRPFVYYVHSYCATNCREEEVYGISRYGPNIVPGLVGKGNILGCQFHPEKSSRDGQAILNYFLEVV